jgi:hypothetical protein
MADIKHLSAYHKLAFELKYKGYSYQNIADSLNKKCPKSRPAKFSQQTIKDWFKEDGRLYKAYCVYENEMDQIHAETMEIVRKAGARVREENFRLANEMLVALMGSSNDAVKLAAIKEILDRVEGKPKENINFNEMRISEMSFQERWNLIPYEIKLRLSRDQYPKETAEMIYNWIEVGKTNPKKLTPKENLNPNQ